MTLFLVRHGRVLGDELDPAGFDEVWALRDRLPQGAAWFTAPEPVAVASVQLLTESDAGILPALGARGPGESPDRLAERVRGTVAGLLEQHAGADVVLVGHLEAWVALVGEPAARLGTPDLLALPDGLGSLR